ncbi:MAG: glycoside hydrolase [Gemmataceae bacterium]|nr:glycoside hydrolase [Gemmataceae bacterium]
MRGDARLEEVDVFISGKEGYHTFRIPAVIVSAKKTVLAFCEGRKDSTRDWGNIDVVLRRSLDGGKTWQPMQLVANFGPDTVGNPCPVVDRATGTIWLPLTKNLGNETEKVIRDGTSKGGRTVWITKSTDDGATWAKPVEITKSVRRDNWTWYATGPGCGIQLNSGRLVIPCDHNLLGSRARHSHVIHSDDGGKTWQIGGVLGENTNECQVVERADGSLLLNMRSYHGKNRRAIATSKDGGLTWSEVTLDQALIEPVCQASLLRYTLAKGGGKNRLLFSNPASTKREKMTVRLSYDEGSSWPVAKLLHEGPSAYSALVVLPDRTIGCLYERGRKSAYEKITFARFTLGWLTDGKDSLKAK